MSDMKSRRTRPARSFNDYFRGGSSSSSSRGGYGRNDRFSGSRGGSRGGSRRRIPEGLAHSKYIQKATPVTLEEYTSSFQFEDLPIDKELKQCILDRGFTSPTPIQDKAIMPILEGRDVIGLADTGTGKTAAFLIPLIQEALQFSKKRKPWSCLIVAPTRELALQIEEELFKLTTKEMWIFSTACVGGSDIRRQIQRLRRQNHFVIGTPGRLIDLLDRNVLKLQDCRKVVLDEVDRMLDMGFIDDIRTLLSEVPEERQTLFFSATLDKKLEPLVHTFLKDPVKVSIKSEAASKNVHQDIIKVSRSESKIEKLGELLGQEEYSKVLIFTRTKMSTERLYEDLQRQGFSVESIHGDKTLGFRKRALDRFKKDQVSILVATDVAARGLDVNNVSHVINYDEPENYETYIHRIGRTGRGGKVGFALTFVEV
jgi:ATP-dependent RNA helicase RhlE